MKYELLYRDASNYKFSVKVEFDEKTFGFDRIQEPGEEIEMEQIGLNPLEFVPARMGHPWNKDDHNILEVIAVLNKDEEVDIILTK